MGHIGHGGDGGVVDEEGGGGRRGGGSEEGEEGFRNSKEAEDVEVEELARGSEGGVGQRHGVAAAGVVEEDVEGTRGLGRDSGNTLGDGGSVLHVEGEGGDASGGEGGHFRDGAGCGYYF